MTVESKPKLRLREIDMLYALGTLLVILGHSHPNDWSTFPGKWIEFIYTFHMPLFFLIAGYLFAYSDSMSRLGYFKWLKEKALRLLTPYVVLTLVTEERRMGALLVPARTFCVLCSLRCFSSH